MQRLSVIIPTFNEAAFIEDALFSVSFADEIIVIDSESTDNTVALAQPLAHKIITRKFDNYSNQKNHALKEATGDWVLFVDADERVTHSLQAEIEATIKNPRHGGYKINFPHFYMNRFLYHHSDDVLRLVKRKGLHFTGLVHEKLHCEGTIGKLKNPMLHYTYKGFPEYVAKKESYAVFQGEQLFVKKKKANWFHLLVKPSFRYFRSYVLKGGFLDGMAGLTVAKVNAYGVFMRYVNLLIKQQKIDGLIFQKRTQQLHEKAKNDAMSLYSEKKKPKWYHFHLIPYLNFIGDFVFQLGFLNGKKGFCNAYVKGFSVFEKYMYVWLAYRKLD